MRPRHASAHNNLGDLLREQGKLDEALLHLDQAIVADPRMAKAHYNRSLVWLSQGRLAEGWLEYEWKWRCAELNTRQFSQPSWDGSPTADATLLVHAEQGLGDTLQWVRYLPLVGRRCPHMVIEVQPSLLPLLAQSGIDGLVAHGAPLPRFDMQISMASLPRIFESTLQSIPAPIPYLQAKPELVEAWRVRLSQCAGFRVGIAWQGSPAYREDRYRSIPLSCFAPLAQVPRVELLSLQKGAGVEQIGGLRGRFRVVDLGSGDLQGGVDEQSGPLMDTAAIMKNLDLVVTSDTVIAHLAGALGVETWVALRLAPDWRWLACGAECPWYPTIRLFRQHEFGDWPGVFAAMATELARKV